MSRAFVKEDAIEEALPDRPISKHTNFVTAAGLSKIEAQVRDGEAARAAARAAGAADLLAQAERELRYWTSRLASARVVTPEPQPTVVRFGVRVHIRYEDGGQGAFTLVGEDEAAPGEGKISWVSPVASSLLGLGIGEAVRIAGRDGEIERLTAG